jgi:GR25 family glycosyltransferase involved in LPS biosynthesis
MKLRSRVEETPVGNRVAPNAVVISYSSAQEADRRLNISRQLTAQGWGCEFIGEAFGPGSKDNYEQAKALGIRLPTKKGIDTDKGKTITNPTWCCNDSDLRMTPYKVQAVEQYYANLSDGAIGCTVSHAIALDRASRNELPTLILESDAYLKDKFTEKLNSVMDNLKDTQWDVLMLAFKELAPVRPQAKERYPQVDGACIAGFCWNTTGYVVSPDGAGKILERMAQSSIMGAIDDIIPTMQWGSPIMSMHNAFGPNQDRAAHCPECEAFHRALITYRTINTLVVEDAVHGRISNTN